MNRFRTKKKAREARDDPGPLSRSSTEEQHSLAFKFRKGKKAPEEEKKEIDLSNALPSSDDFRTSLLMTGLSARFSMLREQDDPSTKIGKASDDSVLFPSKRSSRPLDLGLGGFGGFGGLDDIAEVESIRAPPPLIRADSYASDSEQGSIMSRTRPGEGNVLFGGRQKVYKIPVGSTSSKNVAGGGMGGRQVYDDDVVLSSFQRFKQNEKDRLAMMDTGLDAGLDKSPEKSDTLESTAHPSSDTYDSSFSFPRSDSPSPVGYNLRRETSSTTSSGARNSTAATSVVSQPSTKDRNSQSGAAGTSPANAAAATLERTTTRARRLYEQGLNQDLQEHQSSALSRMDTLAGKRSFGTRTPDFTQSPSPTMAPLDRLGLSPTFSSAGRNILSKASAPNLRSISPPSLPSPTSIHHAPADVSSLKQSASAADVKRPLSPPLSPPFSDSGDQMDQVLLPIKPGDRGKATAMGVFHKPALPYDESRFAERQLQLQHGRETPTQRIRAGSNASYSTAMSSRSSSVAVQAHRVSDQRDAAVAAASPAPAAPTAAAATAAAPVSAEKRLDTFLFDDDDDDSLPAHPSPVPQTFVLLQASLPRPSDLDHPAFRQAALPTPLSATRPSFEEPQVIIEQPEPSTEEDSSLDSPTLGPGAGLSGMVRQHLRNTSNTSSVYSTNPSNLDADVSTSQSESNLLQRNLDVKSNPWDDQEWKTSLESRMGEGDLPKPSQPMPPTLRRLAKDDDLDEDGDDFASQLANARRRVQERLTTYVESDSSRNTSPLLTPTDPGLPLPPSRSNPLGILRGKASRGSLIDRSREVSQTKAMKMLGLNSSAMSSPARPSFDEISISSPVTALPPVPASPSPLVITAGQIKQERNRMAREMETPEPPIELQPPPHKTKAVPAPVLVSEKTGVESQMGGGAQDQDEATMHPGLRAFRNARRQLQKQKEMDTFSRHGPEGSTEDEANQPVGRVSPPNHERRDRKPPPIFYKQRDPSQDSWASGGGRSQPESRSSSRTDRDRSGSDTSNNGSSYGRQGGPPPPRPRNNVPTTFDEIQQGGPHHLGAPRHAGSIRSPGLPGTDIRRSPHMPPQGYPGGGAVTVPSGPGKLSVQTAAPGRQGSVKQEVSGQSPLGSAGLPTSPYHAGPVMGSGSRMVHPSSSSASSSGGFTASTLNESMKRVVKKNDISEPTFVMSTSRVPTVSLPQGTGAAASMAGESGRPRSGSRSRSGSNGGASGGYVPPLPPINPLRKQSGGRGHGRLGGLLGRHGEDGETDMSSASAPHLPLNGSSMSSAGHGHNHSHRMGSSSDEENRAGPRRLHKQPSEAGAMHSRTAGAGLPRPRMDLPGGMI